MRQRGINWPQVQTWYRNKGISLVVNEPVCDDYEASYANDLFRAALVLHDLRDVKGHKVYLNCTAGVSRGPTLMVVYLALFIKHKKWEDIDQLYQFVEDHYRWQDANVKMAKLVVDQNKDFQNKQYKLWLEEQERLKREAEEKARNGVNNIADDEAERLRLLRLLEIEQEKLRVQRQAHADAEKKRLEDLEKQKNERDKRMKKKEDDENRQDEIDRNNQEAEIEALRKKLAKLQKDDDERNKRWKKEDEAYEAKVENQKIKDDEDDRYWIKRLADLKKQQEELEETKDEEKERFLVLKEVELEQSELYERYKVEKQVQAEEYQKRLKNLLGKKDE